MRSKAKKKKHHLRGNQSLIDEDGGVGDVQLAVSLHAKTLTMTSVYPPKDGSEHHISDVFDCVKHGNRFA